MRAKYSRDGRSPRVPPPALDSEMAILVNFYQQGRKDDGFETGIQQGLARVLVAPAFLYRAEDEPAALPEGRIYRLSDLDIASRLSFFRGAAFPTTNFSILR